MEDWREISGGGGREGPARIGYKIVMMVHKYPPTCVHEYSFYVVSDDPPPPSLSPASAPSSVILGSVIISDCIAIINCGQILAQISGHEQRNLVKEEEEAFCAREEKEDDANLPSLCA